jgi:CBS domain-containing protein
MRNSLDAVLDHKGRTVHSVDPDSTVLEAVRKMNQERIGSLLVCENREVVGIFTERDVLTRVLDSDRNPATTPVSEVMTTEPVAVRSTTLVEEAMAIITEKRCRHLPVLDKGELVGLVSIGDLTRWVGRNQEVQIQDLVNFITRKYPA